MGNYLCKFFGLCLISKCIKSFSESYRDRKEIFLSICKKKENRYEKIASER